MLGSLLGSLFPWEAARARSVFVAAPSRARVRVYETT